MSSSNPLPEHRRPLVKANTPNDGLPSNWMPVTENPIIAGAPSPASAPPAGPRGAGPYFAASMPISMQLTPDIMATRFPGGLGAYRIMPPGPSGVPTIISAARSANQ